MRINKLLVGLAIWAVPMVAFAADARPEVKTSFGVVKGVAEDGVESFKGIPYARPPVGDLRWAAPQAAEAWSGIRDAAEYGPVCPQMRPTQLPEDEDCLTVNVWAPEDRPGPLPVMVWIHGGGHVNGSGRTEGSTFARDGIVLVSVNYRLGRFGVFAHPDLLAARAPGAPLGNYGLMDLLAALHWVQQEIGAFGGDPEQVTIFGVSAGASNVNSLMASPLATGLFEGAIAESGGNGFLPLPVSFVVDFEGAIAESGGNGLSRARRLDALVKIGAEVAAAKGVEGIAGLRALPWRSLVDTDARYRSESGPIVDGVVVTDDVGATFRSGHQQNVPYVAGFNSFEGSLAAAIPIPIYDQILDQNRERIAEAYGVAPDDPSLSLAFYGDMLFGAATRHLVRQMRHVAAPGWFYHYDYVLEPLRPHVPGTSHGGEVAFVFDRLRTVSIGPAMAARLGVPAGDYEPTAKDHEVAAMTHRYWVQFAKTGDPNLTGQPVWPAYDQAADPALVFSNDGIEVRSGLRRARLDLIEEGYLTSFTGSSAE